MIGEGAPLRPKRVFLSYAWESDEFRLWVQRLATRLREDGVESRLDEWHLSVNGNIAEFMNYEVREADWVLVVCSPGYQQKVHATESGARVSGVAWESRLLTSMILGLNENKILAVLAKGEWHKAAPDSLRGQVYFDLSRPATFEDRYNALLTAISGSGEKAPPLGPLPNAAIGEPVEALRYSVNHEAKPSLVAHGTGPGSASRWVRREGLALLGMGLAIDLLMAWFVSTTLPSSTFTVAQLCIALSPPALLIAILFNRLWSSVRRRLRREKE